MSLGIVFYGLVTGSAYALIAIGLVLVFRVNRVINFALAEIGVAGAVLFENLVRASHWPWAAGVAAGTGGACVLGVALERLIAQRFFNSPRLILSVVTIGMAQLVVAIEIGLINAFGTFPASAGLVTPLSGFRFKISGVAMDGNAILLLATVVVAVVAINLVMRRTDTGIAMRASAENIARASTLGVPVRNLSTVAWAIASLAAALAIIFRSPVVGLVTGNSLIGPGLLLGALTAAVLGRFESITGAALAGLTIGVMEQILFYSYGGSTVVYAAFVGVIVLALFFQRSGNRRADVIEDSSWTMVAEERPMPSAIARLREIRAGRLTTYLALAATVVGLPAALSQSAIYLASDVIIVAIVAVSLVVLTGWSGQISLGQLGLAAVGGAVAARVSVDAHWDFLLALLIGGCVAGGTSMLLGAASFRIRGFYFAVTSLAFAVAVESFFLNGRFFSVLLPVNRPQRPLLLSRLDLNGELAFFYFCAATLGLACLAVATWRKTRTGRVLIAMRDNDRAARALGISRVRTRLMGFGISGFIAGVGGALLVVHDHAVSTSQFTPAASIALFSMVVIGGLGSVTGVLLGVVVVQTAALVLPPGLSPLATGAGLLIVLLVLPGGIGRAAFLLRDRFVHHVALRHGIAPDAVTDQPPSGKPGLSVPGIVRPSEPEGALT